MNRFQRRSATAVRPANSGPGQMAAGGMIPFFINHSSIIW